MILEVPREYGIIAFTSVHGAPPPSYPLSVNAKIGTRELEIANSRQEGHFIRRGLAHMKIVTKRERDIPSVELDAVVTDQGDAMMEG